MNLGEVQATQVVATLVDGMGGHANRDNNIGEFHSDELYEEPSPDVWSKVKVEKTDRSEFRANLKATKYAGKERVESTTFDSNEGNDGKEGRA
jgi:hypothetical protein